MESIKSGLCFSFAEYVSVIKDKAKTVEKLEAMVEKQQDGKLLIQNHVPNMLNSLSPSVVC